MLEGCVKPVTRLSCKVNSLREEEDIVLWRSNSSATLRSFADWVLRHDHA